MSAVILLLKLKPSGLLCFFFLLLAPCTRGFSSPHIPVCSSMQHSLLLPPPPYQGIHCALKLEQHLLFLWGFFLVVLGIKSRPRVHKARALRLSPKMCVCVCFNFKKQNRKNTEFQKKSKQLTHLVHL